MKIPEWYEVFGYILFLILFIPIVGGIKTAIFLDELIYNG